MSTVRAILVALLGVCANAQFSPNCANGRDGKVMVHLFEWKWTDIAAECERYLGPKGFCGIQVSPPNEHRIVNNRPWWERYQPVSYKLDSRSGNRAQFVDMVQRCNNAGVRIYVDAVINHMAGVDSGRGTGTAGSSYDTQALTFSGVPFGPTDFNSCSKCGNANCNINSDYGDVNKVRNCRLVGLADLDCGKDYVRQKIADYLNDAVSIGVDGFRIDAAKHMWPGDLSAIVAKTRNTPHGGRPYIYQEVIDLSGSEAIKSSEYLGVGAVQEFKYGLRLSDQIYGNKGMTHLANFGSSWGMLPSDKAFVFIDNHDNQRGHGGGGTILTHKYGKPYTVALVFMLAWPYGVPQIMSSFSFTNGDQGPPSDNGNTKDVPILPDGLCGNGWVCEHRWRPVGNMVAWRNAAGSRPVANWWSNGRNQIAFSRGDTAFVVINYNDGTLSADLSTGLPSGTYCDVISGNVVNGRCTGKTIQVGGNGKANFQINGADQDPMIAIHINAKSGGPDTGAQVPPPAATQAPNQPQVPPPTGTQRTVVLLKKVTAAGQDLFLRGGVDSTRCTGGDCKISITYSAAKSGTHYDKFNAWKVNDAHLDWAGAESGQGQYNGQAAQGSPMFWTTNAQGPAHAPENTFGEHYWMWEVNMDCSKTHQGWFEVKGYLGGSWEPNISQSSCTGTAGGRAPFTSTNHLAKCGSVNVFEWGSGSCSIN